MYTLMHKFTKYTNTQTEYILTTKRFDASQISWFYLFSLVAMSVLTADRITDIISRFIK